jgi:hypothetical protein
VNREYANQLNQVQVFGKWGGAEQLRNKLAGVLSGQYFGG